MFVCSNWDPVQTSYLHLCNILALDGSSCDSCTDHPSRQKSILGTCRSWSIWDIGIWIWNCFSLVHSKWIWKYLNPRIGFCLQMLHLAWCFAVSAAVNLERRGIKRWKICPNYLFIIIVRHMAGFSWNERISSLGCCEALATSFITLPSTNIFRFIHGLILRKLIQITGLRGSYFAIRVWRWIKFEIF